MKILFKTYALLPIIMLAFIAQTNGQTRKKTTVTKTTTIKKVTPKKTATTKRISSNKVQYRTQKKKVVSVRTVPNKTVIKYNGQNYYYANNKYYTYSRGHYIVIAPKIGFKTNILPNNYNRIVYNQHIYYNVDGIFYNENNNNYEVVEPEIGTVVYELPSDYEKVTVDGQTYYEYANVLYEKVQINGTRAYEVVGIIDIN
ncbi:DUF6515 family protein [Lacinutrix undariae]